MFDALIDFIREQYGTAEPIPLHAPVFGGREREYVLDTIESTFVSSVGSFVERFERAMAELTGSPRAVATVNGTAALHIALQLAGVRPGDLVVTQSLTFVATCNAIAYCHAEPVFVDVDRDTLGMSPAALDAWLESHATVGDDGVCYARTDRRPIRACLPMHTFGHPVALDELLEVAGRWRLAVVEDAAESLGSSYKGRHTGTFGVLGTSSFNGNKIITTGGGGMVFGAEDVAARAKHLTTTAKQNHAYEYVHDALGYNYRMPNINAALGCAQIERLQILLAAKRALAEAYARELKGGELAFVTEPVDCRSNYWLNAVICPDRRYRDLLLEHSNARGVMTRPIWTLMNRLPMYQACRRDELTNANWLEERVVNLPSSPPPRYMQ